MTDKNMKDKIHDTAEHVKEKTAELKGEMKVKADHIKHNIEKGADHAKQKAAELKGEMKEHIHETGKKVHEMKEKIADKDENSENQKES